jgi:anti-sigma factor RsiW
MSDNRHDVEELLGAYALDAVDDDERQQVEAHLAVCPRCEAEVRDHREVAALLAHTGGAAPEGLWNRIAEHLDEAPPELELEKVTALRPPRPPAEQAPAESTAGTVSAPSFGSGRSRGVPGRYVAAFAGLAAAIIAFLGVQLTQQNERIDDLSAALSEDGLVRAYNAALVDPAADVAELRSEDGDTVVRVVLQPDGHGFLAADGLPALDDERTYQLWGVAGDTVVSLGILGAEPDLVPFESSVPLDAIAITDESAPVVTSVNPPVVQGTLA